MFVTYSLNVRYSLATMGEWLVTDIEICFCFFFLVLPFVRQRTLDLFWSMRMLDACLVWKRWSLSWASKNLVVASSSSLSASLETFNQQKVSVHLYEFAPIQDWKIEDVRSMPSVQQKDTTSITLGNLGQISEGVRWPGRLPYRLQHRSNSVIR